MKVLLDENIDIRFALLFNESKNSFHTVKEMNWTGVKNGKLLQLMVEYDFSVLIAVDKNLPYQQNIKDKNIRVLIPDVVRNTLEHLKPFVPLILEELTHFEMGTMKVLSL